MVEFMRLCCQLEKRTGQIYWLLQQMKGFSTETLDLFTRMEQEESRHSGMILGEMSRVPGGYVMIPCDLKFPILLAQQTDEIIETLQNRNLRELQAVRLARNLEMRFWDLHLNNALAFQDEKWKDLFVDLSRGEKEHLRLLSERFIELTDGVARSSPAWTEKQL